MSRAFTHTLRIVAGVAFASAFSFFITGMFYTNVFSWSALITFFTNLRDLVSAGLYMLFYWAPQGVNIALGGLFGSQQGLLLYDPQIARGINNSLLNWYIFFLFSFPAKTRTDPLGNPIEVVYLTNISGANKYFMVTLGELFKDIYSLVFLLLGLVAILNAIFCLTRTRAKYSLNSVMAMAGMVIVPLTIIAVQNMLAIFGLSWDVLANLPATLRPEITETLGQGWVYFTKPLFSAILLIYLFIELSFQLEYADLVTKPSMEREERLEYQLESLQREGMRITTTIEKIQEKVKEKKKEAGTQQNRLKQFFSKAGGFSYVKEMVEKRKFEKTTQRWLEAASDTRRLGSYVQRLTTEDPEARRTLTAKSSAPTAGKMLSSTLINIGLRAVAIIMISFVIIQPQFILNGILTGFNTINPPLDNYVILHSAEIQTPEAILVLLIPIIMSFPISSIIIKQFKKQRLKELLRQEESRRQAVEQSIFSARPAESASTAANATPQSDAGSESSQELKM